MSAPTHRLISLALSFFVVFQFQFEGIAGGANDVVIRTCNIAAARDRNNIHVDLCVKALAAAPGSESANLFELGAISIELAREKVSETRVVIESLLQNKKKNKKNKNALRDCEKLYTDAAAALRVATADYLSGRYGDAKTKLSVVMTAVTSCEDGFKEHGVVSPLAKRNADAFQLSAVSLSILAMRPQP